MDEDEKTPQEQLGQMAASFMEFAEKAELETLTLAGIALAGTREDGKHVILTRTTARDAFACTQLWAGALELELDSMKVDIVRSARAAHSRIDFLEHLLELHGIEHDEP